MHKVAADVIAFYHLFPSNIRKKTKLADLNEVVSWSRSVEPPDLSVIEPAYENGIGSAGMYYLAARPAQIAYYLDFARRTLTTHADPTDRERCEKIAVESLETVDGGIPARNIALHLLFPDYYEPISSDRHKSAIVSAFKNLTGKATDKDEALVNIRRALEIRHEQAINFYEEPVRSAWLGESGVRAVWLNRIADLLTTRRLTDKDLLSDKGWRELVKPVTRPFLQSIAEAIDDSRTKFHTGGDAAKKRDTSIV